jgi:hypothetical protein
MNLDIFCYTNFNIEEGDNTKFMYLDNDLRCPGCGFVGEIPEGEDLTQIKRFGHLCNFKKSQ